MNAWLPLPIARPLSLNDRTHWAVKARQVKQVRGDVAQLARAAGIPPLKHVHVTLHYRPRDNRRRDTDSLVATLKPAIDGLRDAGLVPDDTPEYVSWSEPVIHPAMKGASRSAARAAAAVQTRLWLELVGEEVDQ